MALQEAELRDQQHDIVRSRPRLVPGSPPHDRPRAAGAALTLAALGLVLVLPMGCATTARREPQVKTDPWGSSDTYRQYPSRDYRPERTATGEMDASGLDPLDPGSPDSLTAHSERSATDAMDFLRQRQAALGADGTARRSTEHSADRSNDPGSGTPSFHGAEIGRTASAFGNDPAPTPPRAEPAATEFDDRVIFNLRSGAAPAGTDEAETAARRPRFDERQIFGATQGSSSQGPSSREPAQGVMAREEARFESVDADPLALDDLRMLMIEMRKHIYRDSVESDQPLRELIALAMMSYLDPDLELEPEAFRDLTDDERELLGELQTFFRGLGDRLDGSLPPRDVITDELLKLKGRLIEEPEIQIPAAALCWKVDGFAVYTEIERYAFLALKPQQVILYLEIDGFTSEQNRNEDWVTEISQLVEIYSDRDGVPVWSDDWIKFSDVSKQQRNDFYIARIITVPDRLSVGKYHLKVRMRDEKSGAEAETSMEFQVVADPKLAVGG